MKEEINIQELIYKQIIGDASEEELKKLNLWRQKDLSNEKLYQSVIDPTRIKASFSVYDAIDVNEAFERILKPKPTTRRLAPMVLKYAAAIALPLLLALSVWMISDFNQNDTKVVEAIAPLSQKATVELSDGRIVNLQENNTVEIEEHGSIVGEDSENKLIYKNVSVAEEIFHTIKTPYGGEYQLELSDGSKVWLNSGSELRFPVNFVGDTREVYLTGEGYFEVAHNPQKPFKVNTINSTVQVYGTSFNVMSYDNDKVQQITLVDGKIGLEAGDENLILKPGEQAELNKGNLSVEVSQVETELYTGWTSGVLKFNDMPLRELSKKLSRWYDVEFFFANSSVGNIHFTGRVRKDIDFSYFMSLIEKTTNVSIVVDDRTVLIKELK
ncbi:FecR domain-containing protein [Carboxylicivirga sp. A043]|uniref:FecR family protein n=1 Tax=Carboxylicivirga litoralis TaxID=2816963 RepID=UPI0021CB64D7|nr:FecR domain-containing protein [Carboxylicivirga sp. A043]MCU4155857.1 FecR domain-containing protein [Carboxylicivirga sp. A043]